MSNDNTFRTSSQKQKSQQEEFINLKKVFLNLIPYWHYFLIALIVFLICAFLYNKYTIPTYRVSATLLINEENKAASIGTDQLLEGFRLGSGMKNLDNQIRLLSSRTLIERTLDELNFDIEYYYRGPYNIIALYPKHPIKVVSEIADSLSRDVEFTFKYLSNNMFTLDAESEDSFALHTKSSFGEIIKFPGGSFHIESESNDWPVGNKNRNIYFMCHSREKLVESYSKRMKVVPESKTGTIVRISLEGTNKTMDMDFLNKLTEIFIYNSLDKKNLEAIRTIQFIDDQLIGISDSLVITENKLQQFRSRNRVMNLSAQGQVIIDQAMSLENQKARLGVEANYYDYLADYLAKDSVGMAPIAPATMGITDPGLTKLVADLADLQGQFYSSSPGKKNLLQRQLDQRLRYTKEALRETLNGVRRSNNIAMSEITEQIRTVNAQASALPVTERQLLGIERKYKLNDELYTFLLEKRAGAQIQKASNMPDNEIVDPAKPDFMPVRPKTTLIYVMALMAGIGFPSLWIWFVDAFNNKVKEEEDIKKITDIPVVGHIPHSQMRKNTVVLEEPRSHAAEAFRSLRFRMQFFTKEIKTPVILVTSSMQEEGKTFSAVNLASVYSLAGKKTVLVGFDLRKPKIYTDFGLGNDNGVSTWLIGKDGLQDIIKKTKYENLSVITSGPVPPYPSELISLKKTEELLRLLKENFECIIIDTSPIGVVSDTFHLASLADTCILIVRQNETLKDLLESTLKELKICDIKSICIVVNDLGPDYNRYGYGGSYGYSYRKEKNKN
jgi:capsular exopolysaccharide synthesis family protein